MRPGLAPGLLDVSETLTEERQDVLVVKGVEDHSAFAPGPDDPGIAEKAKLVGNGRFGDPELTGEIADTQLGSGQRVEDADARRVAENAKDLGQAIDGMGIEL
jgi:hypothetical protein